MFLQCKSNVNYNDLLPNDVHLEHFCCKMTETQQAAIPKQTE